jgi:hypothetical protein
MALTEEAIVDSIDVLSDGQIQVRTATVVKRDSVEISRTFHRHVVVPGADLSSQDARVKSVGEAVHTAEVIAAYRAAAEAARE